VDWSALSDKHVGCNFEQEKTTQPDDDQCGEVDVPLAIDQTLHGRYVLPTRPDRKARMRVPLAQIVETSEVGSRSSKEPVESLCMMIGTADEVSGGSARLIDREVDNPKVVWRDLLAHEDASDLAPSDPS
jgi:hypothetical protein